MKKMEDISGSAGTGLGAGAAMQKVLGKVEAERLNKIYQKVIRSRMRQIVKFRPDLSTSGNE
jgi:helix-turn-helix protein